MSNPDEALTRGQRHHSDSTHAEHVQVYGSDPPEGAQLAASAPSHDDLLELPAGHGRDALFALDHSRGDLSRREALRRLAYLGLATPAAMALLVACAGDEDAPKPANPRLSDVNVKSFGAVGDGVTDDTAALQSAVAAALAAGGGAISLPKGVYGLSEELQFVGANAAAAVVGVGQEASVFKALGPDAALVWGEQPTGVGLAGIDLWGRPGMNKGFGFDGNGVATQGIIIGSLVSHTTWEGIDVDHVSGDAWDICPQNSTFISCLGRNSRGNGWTLDYGIQTCEFIQCHAHSNDGWGFEIRQSGGPGWGASAQPQSLRFISGIVEQGGSPLYADTGLGGVHIREGLDITFERFELVDHTGDGALVLTPSTANGYVGRIVVRDCRIYNVYLDANNGSGVAQSMGGTNDALYLTGWNVFVYGGKVINGSTGRVYHDGAGTVPYVAEGAGARGELSTVPTTKPF